jgi:hypothetical protein
VKCPLTSFGPPKGNGYQATVTFPDGVSMTSDEIGEAITAAAMKLLLQD